MARAKDEIREQRIAMEAVVDAYGSSERAMGWYYYLDGKMKVPFRKRPTPKLMGVDDPLSIPPAGARFSVGLVELPARSDRASIAHPRPHTPPQSRSPRGTIQREICLFPIGRPSPY